MGFADVTEEEEERMEVEKRARGVLSGEDDGGAEQAAQSLSVFEDAFEKIKEATGVSDIPEVIHKIVNQEDTQNNLMSLTKENQGKIESLRGSLEVASSRVDEIKYSGSGTTQKRKLVDDHEANLTCMSCKQSL